jgi:hypothetical protein
MSTPTSEFQHLTAECGHHCIAQRVGLASLNVSHCSCSECHGRFVTFKVIDDKVVDVTKWPEVVKGEVVDPPCLICLEPDCKGGCM